MQRQSVRPAAVAGSWYPGTAAALGGEVDGYLDAVRETPKGEIVALIAPHAGLVYSGPVAAHAYRAVAGRAFDVAVLVGPSHFVGFDGVAVYESGAFDHTSRSGPCGRDVRRGGTSCGVIEHPTVCAGAHT